MEKVKHLRNSLKMVEKVLNKSLKDIFDLDGKVMAKSYDKDTNYDYQSAYAMMTFKKLKKHCKYSKIAKPDLLANYLLE